MIKKMCSMLASLVVISVFSVTAYAADFITITRPDGDETTFKTSYVICGNTDKEDITVELSIYDSNIDSFVPFSTIDEETSWKIGSSGIFMKEVSLNTGANKVRIEAFSESERDVRQSNTFTITVLQENIKDKIMNNFVKVTDMLGNIFNN